MPFTQFAPFFENAIVAEVHIKIKYVNFMPLQLMGGLTEDSVGPPGYEEVFGSGVIM